MVYKASIINLFKGFSFRYDFPKILIFALSYFLAHQLSFFFPDSEKVIMLVWPAGGIGLAAFLLNPKRLWPFFTLAFYIAGITADVLLGNRSLLTGFGYMTGNMVESIGCAWLILKTSDNFKYFTRLREVLALITGTVFINAFSSGIGAWTSVVTRSTAFWDAWQSWYISDGLGILLIGPFIITWVVNKNDNFFSLSYNKIIESLICIILWTLVSIEIFYPDLLIKSLELHTYILVALLAWPAIRFGQRGVTLALIILFLIAIFSPTIINDPSPWGGNYEVKDLASNMLELQLFLGFISMVGYVMAAGYASLKRVEEALKLNEFRLESLLRISKYNSETLQEFLDYALNEVILLTKSKIGYIFFYDENKKEFTLNTLSKGVKEKCNIENQQTVYQLENTGIWGEAVRQRQPIIINDFDEQNPLKKGYPEGHVILNKFLTIPVFNNNQIVSVVGVANKETDYDSSDIRQLVLMMDSVWKIAEETQSGKILRESEEKYRLLHESAGIGIGYYKPDGTVISYNSLAASHMNGHPDDFTGKSIYDIFPKKDAEFYHERIKRAALSDKSVVYEDLTELPAGNKYFLSTFTKITDLNKHTTGIQIISQDITELKQTEEALRENEQRLLFYLNNSPMAVIEWDAKFFVTRWSGEAEKIFGWSVEEVRGKSIMDLKMIFEEDISIVQDTMRQLTDGVSKQVISSNRNYTKDKQIIYCEWYNTVLYDQNRNMVSVMSQVLNITERKSAESQLAKSRDLLINLARLVPGVIYQYRLYPDGSSAFPYASPGMNDIYEVTPEEVREDATPVFGRLHPEDFDHVSNSIQESARTLKTFFCEFRVVLPRQGLRWRWSQAQPERTADGGTLWYGIISDITERKQYEKDLMESNKTLENTLIRLEETQRQVSQQEKLRSLGQMASGIAHDINNSLTPIMGYIDLLRDEPEIFEKHEEELNKIIKSTKSIARTIGRLREFYKVKDSDDELQEKDLNKIVEHTIELTAHRWKNMPESTGSVIEVKKQFQKDLPLTRVDESELIEALTNLILNACDAMPNGGILSFITYQELDHIIIEVKDNGKGMDEKTLKHCIDPFFTTKGNKGTGLGLAMVFGVIDRHDGKVEITSKKNEGTSVKLIIPIISSKKELKEIDEITQITKSLKILSVEDDETISGMLKRMLIKRNHLVEVSSNGILGLELYRQALGNKNPFDLVITDLGMAEMDGNALSKFIKDITPDVPIILLTGWGTLINQDDYPTIDYLLKKPFTTEELFCAINELFKEE